MVTPRYKNFIKLPNYTNYKTIQTIIETEFIAKNFSITYDNKPITIKVYMNELDNVEHLPKNEIMSHLLKLDVRGNVIVGIDKKN